MKASWISSSGISLQSLHTQVQLFSLRHVLPTGQTSVYSMDLRWPDFSKNNYIVFQMWGRCPGELAKEFSFAVWRRSLSVVGVFACTMLFCSCILESVATIAAKVFVPQVSCNTTNTNNSTKHGLPFKELRQEAWRVHKSCAILNFSGELAQSFFTVRKPHLPMCSHHK